MIIEAQHGEFSWRIRVPATSRIIKVKDMAFMKLASRKAPLAAADLMLLAELGQEGCRVLSRSIVPGRGRKAMRLSAVDSAESA